MEGHRETDLESIMSREVWGHIHLKTMEKDRFLLKMVDIYKTELLCGQSDGFYLARVAFSMNTFTNQGIEIPFCLLTWNSTHPAPSLPLRHPAGVNPSVLPSPRDGAAAAFPGSLASHCARQPPCSEGREALAAHVFSWVLTRCGLKSRWWMDYWLNAPEGYLKLLT